MATDVFMKLSNGVKGESKDAKHPDEIEIYSWSFGASNSGTMHEGTGGGAGKANLSDFTVSKRVDSSSNMLLYWCYSGTHFDSATITIRKAGGTQLDYLIYTLKNCLITSVQQSGSGESGQEAVSINSAEVDFSYAQQKDDGSLDTAKTVNWNTQTNTGSPG